MKRIKHAKVLGMLCSLLMLLTLLSSSWITASAAEAYNPLVVEIPYKHVYTTTDTAVDSVFHYTITVKDDAPLPAEASETGSFSFNGVSGKGQKSGDSTVFTLPGKLTFTFTKPGVYSYELKADLETDSQKKNASRYTFEPRTTTINLYITNAPDGEMQLKMLTAEDDEDVKPVEIELDPVYKHTAKPSPWNPKTGDDVHLWRYIAIVGASASMIVVLLLLGKKKGREENA